MDETLKACPFCGGAGPVFDMSEHADPRLMRSFVFCSTCEATTRDHDTPDEAIAAWNRRTPDADAMRRALEEIRDRGVSRVDCGDHWHECRECRENAETARTALEAP